MACWFRQAAVLPVCPGSCVPRVLRPSQWPPWGGGGGWAGPGHLVHSRRFSLMLPSMVAHRQTPGMAGPLQPHAARRPCCSAQNRWLCGQLRFLRGCDLGLLKKHPASGKARPSRHPRPPPHRSFRASLMEPTAVWLRQAPAGLCRDSQRVSRPPSGTM